MRSNDKFIIATVEKNSIGGWTVRYPIPDALNGKGWFSEAHFDHNRKAEALALAHEKESDFVSATLLENDIEGGI